MADKDWLSRGKNGTLLSCQFHKTFDGAARKYGFDTIIKKNRYIFGKNADTLGKVEVSNQNDRICLKISKQGTAYVHEQVSISPFLVDFIEKITMPGCTLEEIKKVFYKYSTDVVIKDGIHDGLGKIFYFEDETIDPYVYCLEFDEFGATYHRFDKLDFEHL